MKQYFEVLPFCSSKYSDKNSNTLSRIVNSFALELNTKFYLPDYIIIVLDDDLINFLQYKRYNVASLLGPWIEYLAQYFAETLQERFQALPLKAKGRDCPPPQVYWVEPIGHTNFDYIDQQVREVFTHCLEANCKIHENMRVLKLREFWNKHDDSLVVNNRFTKLGLAAYWRSIDASFKFNLAKRDEFLVRAKFRTLRAKQDRQVLSKKAVREDTKDSRADADVSMREFFIRHRSTPSQTNDRFHWKKSGISGSPKFLLPRLNRN